VFGPFRTAKLKSKSDRTLLIIRHRVHQIRKMSHNQAGEENSSQTSLKQGQDQVSTPSSEPSSTQEIASVEDPEKAQPAAASAAQEEDPNVVFWDGPDDPHNPANFSNSVKWGNIGLLSVLSTLTPLASSMFAPGVPQLMEHFHSNRYETETATLIWTLIFILVIL